MTEPFVLVNSNVSTPPVSPVGLEYTGHALEHSGVDVAVIDLAFNTDWRETIRNGLAGVTPIAVGVSVRNTDDVCFATKKSFLPWIRNVVAEVKKSTAAPVVLGGVGYSTAPVAVLRQTGADFGIDGDSELAVGFLVKALLAKGDVANLPNLVHRRGNMVVCNPRAYTELDNLPLPKRELFDNVRYEKAGAMVGVETKRGCPQLCIYCADPVAKGPRVRLRPPAVVVAEVKNLLGKGVSWFHLCDSEFNQPLRHAKDICRAIIDAGIGSRIHWYCYCCPIPFDAELAGMMVRAGCAGVNFGVDSLVDEQLGRLGREHHLGHIWMLVDILKQAGVNFLFDFIIGGPGETPGTVKLTVTRVKQMAIPVAGMSVGVRVYHGTPLGNTVSKGFLHDGVKLVEVGEGFDSLVFYCAPSLGNDPLAMVRGIIGDDPRFLLLSGPSDADSYNYAGDTVLAQAILEGARGAYWDILIKRRKLGLKV